MRARIPETPEPMEVLLASQTGLLKAKQSLLHEKQSFESI